MQRCIEKEANEIANVSEAYTRAHPRTVMIVHLNTETTFATVV